MANQEQLVKKIKVLTDSIRKKNRALKSDISVRDNYLETTFKPVIGPLKEISRKLDEKTPITSSDDLMPVKSEDIKGEGDDENTENEEGVSSEVVDDDDEDDVVSETDVRTPTEKGAKDESNLTVLGRDIASHGELTRKYVLKMLHGTLANRRYHVYGARLERHGLMIGDSELKLDDDDNIYIKGKKYSGTHGLFELIFKKIPMRYSVGDLQAFKRICIATNVHKKNYLPDSPEHRGSSSKYKNIIAKIFPPKISTGKGMSMKNTSNTNVFYYNDVNKLVERMRLLHEARKAGHTGVDNEMVALTEELRRRDYIL